MARELSHRRHSPAPDEDLVASLLCDLGAILLRQSFQKFYEPVWTGSVEHYGSQQCDWEERQFGVHHAELSTALLASWHMPPEIVEPIRLHHHPERASQLPPDSAHRAILLDFVGHMAQLANHNNSPELIESILHKARDHFGMDRPELETFLNEMRPRIEEFAAILHVDIGSCPSFDQMLAAGCDELVRASLQDSTGASRTHDAGFIPAATCVSPSASRAILIETPPPARKGASLMDRLFADAADANAKPQILHYVVEEVLGRGAMGMVLKAFDPGLARPVALKIMAPQLAGNEKARLRFALEARFAASIRHQNVVGIFGVEEVDGSPVLIMEYVAGVSLQDRVEKKHPFSVPEIAKIGGQSAMGLSAAHELRLIHRDIKPANILIEEETQIAHITDFGLARAMDEDFQLSQPGMLVGTPNFMSPEQVDGKRLTPASDLFSLGSVLYVLCTGRLPFPAQTMSELLHAVAEKDPVAIRDLNPDIPGGMAELVSKLHSKNPAERYPSAAAVAESLRAWCD